MSPDTIDRVASIRGKVHSDSRVSVTDFARGRRWREELPQCGVIEIVDRTETAGFLLSKEGMNSLLETIDSLEEQVERAQIDAMFAARSDYQNPLEGDSLVEGALASFEARKDALREILDVDKR